MSLIQQRMIQPTNQDPTDPEATGSHEEFWVFSQVSQWGAHWKYSSNEHLNNIRNIVIKTRSLGIMNNYPPRMVHFAQMLLWRFYIKESISNYNYTEIIPLAFESAAQLLETRSPRDHIVETLRANGDGVKRMSEFQQHFNLVIELDFNIRIHHPSEYLPQFITPQFKEYQYQLAECIIADSYLCPCCLVHRPNRIAEGAAIMAAGMTNSPTAVIPKSVKAISFIQDMKCFYQQSINHQRNQ